MSLFRIYFKITCKYVEEISDRNSLCPLCKTFVPLVVKI